MTDAGRGPGAEPPPRGSGGGFSPDGPTWSGRPTPQAGLPAVGRAGAATPPAGLPAFGAGPTAAAPTPRAGLPAVGPPRSGGLARPARLVAGQVLGPWRLEVELGRGGMGAVWRAQDAATGRVVALKVVHGLDARARLRFAREGELAARVVHPGVVRVFAAGDADGVPWLACELVEGARSLTAAAAGLPPAARVALARDAARALGAAHAQGLVHRDVKPDNLLVGADGRVRVTDFGVATALDLERLTQTGGLVGTPAYMAPEQVRGQRDRLGPPTDVWALGVVLYELLAGARPFQGASSVQLALEIVQAAPRPLGEVAPGVDPAVAAVVARALEADPAARWPDGEALALALDAALATPGPPARARLPRLARALALAAGLVLVAAGGVAWRRAGAPAGAAPVGPPARLVLEATAEGLVVGPDGLVEVRGVVLVGADGADGADGEGGVGAFELGAAGARPVARVAAGAPFVVRLAPPPAGDLVVVARDGDGREARAALPVDRRAPPAWWTRVPPALRPPWPLPAGLEPGERTGELVCARDGSVLVWVPPATFVMGGGPLAATDAVDGGGPVPERQVTLTRGFFLGKHEVTWRQLERYCAEVGRAPPPRPLSQRLAPREVGGSARWVDLPGPPFEPGDDHPAWRVTWELARDYCAWAGLRLPTEAEWELAARGTDGRRHPWGDAPPSPRHVNMAGDQDRFLWTAPVGSFPAGASPSGCLDMAGNVQEVVADWLGPVPEGPATDPTGPPSGTRKVVRGGSWLIEFADGVTTTFRTGATPEGVHVHQGFRVARSP